MKNIRNQVRLIGNIGADPVLKELESNDKLTNFNLAVNERFTDSSGQKVDRADWFNIVAWNKTAELAVQLLKKGTEIICEGKLKTRSYQKDDVTVYVTEIVMDSFLIISKKENQ